MIYAMVKLTHSYDVLRDVVSYQQTLSLALATSETTLLKHVPH